MTTDYDSVIRELSERRDVLQADLDRIETALKLISELSGVSQQLSEIEPQAQKMSVRQKVVALLNEEPETWRLEGILQEWAKRGDPIQGKNPKSSLRTALRDALRAGEIQRVTEGLYCSSKWKVKTRDTAA